MPDIIFLLLKSAKNAKTLFKHAKKLFKNAKNYSGSLGRSRVWEYS